MTTSEEIIIELNTIEEALHDIKEGKVIIVVDDEDRENEGERYRNKKYRHSQERGSLNDWFRTQDSDHGSN